MADQSPSAEGKPTPKGNRFVALVGLSVLLVLGLFFGVPAALHAHSHEDTDDAFIDADVVELAPRVPGQVQKVHVVDNQMVKKGDLLVEIDPSDYQAAVDEAAANLAQAEEKERSSRLSVGLTRHATEGGMDEARAGVDESHQAVHAAGAAVATARSQVEGADAQVQSAQARLNQARQQVDEAQDAVRQARAGVVSSQAEARRTTDDARRYRELYAQNAASQQQRDQALAAAREADANLVAARSKVSGSQAQVAAAQANVRSAEGALSQAQAMALTARTQVAEAQAREEQAAAAIGEAQGKLVTAQGAPDQMAVSRQQVRTEGADVRAARAAWETARLRLGYTRIYAPSDGRVTKKAVEVGQVVQTGQNLLALVSPKVWVTANFKETQLQLMQPGQPVDIEVEAYPGRTFTGHVDSIQAGSGAAFSLLPPENATGNYVKVVQRVPVKIVFDQIPPDLVLGPGMTVMPSVKVR